MNWTFGQKIAAGFASTLALTVIMGLVCGFTLRSVTADKDRLLSEYTGVVVEIERLNTLTSEALSGNRGYYITGDRRFATRAEEAQLKFNESWAKIARTFDSPREQALGRDVDAALSAHKAITSQLVRLRASSPKLDVLIMRFDDEAAPRGKVLKDALEAVARLQSEQMEAAKQRSTQAADNAIALVIAILLLAVAVATALAFGLTRGLTRQIGSATAHLQSSSAELQAAANQQVTGSGEQAAAMSEVSTTMKELLSTSRQIAESAQRVARIADETAEAARTGDMAVGRAQEAVGQIKRQVDTIVAHMLDLGKKTQQIGGILDIITELAEQTNILSINATIEAAGAGEGGKRFAAVAEEIRKLADRVSGSTREIRTLIDEARAAANTTVMATEDGAKAVEAGARQFSELASTFRQIVSLVGTTAEAAREIELSTKQQTTAVEQVNVAIADAAQAAKETEASSRQTLDTSSQLANVSRELAQLVQPAKAA